MAEAGAMRWWVILSTACFLTMGCERGRQREPAFTEQQIEEMREFEPGLLDKCLERLRWDGILGEHVDECYEMDEAKRWKGILHYDLEEVRFCEDAIRQCPAPDRDTGTWLDIPDQVKRPKVLTTLASGPMIRDFEFEFIGRRTRYPGSHGHMGAYRYEIIADRIISVREVTEGYQSKN